MSSVFVLVFSVLFAMVGPISFAHDGGHGPTFSDVGKQGGIVSAVVDAKDASKGHHAEALYKAEIVRNEDGTVYVSLYDMKMNALNAIEFNSAFNETAQGTVEFKKSKKWMQESFTLTKVDGDYQGKAPKSKVKPYNIDIVFKDSKGRELLTVFNNLD